MGKTLLEDGPAHKRLTLSLTEFGDARLLDIRYWYFDKKSSEYKSTKKGISLTGSKFNAVIGALVGNRDEISQWLDVATVPEHVLEYAERQDSAIENNLYSGRALAASSEERPRDTRFFEAEHSGGLDKVVFNRSRDFVRRLEEQLQAADASDELWFLFSALVTSYVRARAQIADTPVSHPDILLDDLELNWARMLDGYVD